MDKILNNLGLCLRAGKLVHGTDAVVEGIKCGKVLYVFLANDASANTIKPTIESFINNLNILALFWQFGHVDGFELI